MNVEIGDATLYHGDCIEVLRSMSDNSVDSIVTDPPYGLTSNKKGGSGAASVNLDNPYGRARIGTGNGAGGFMGLKWDSDVPPIEVWAECLRVLKPGGHLLAFAGTRTQHRMAVRIEDAGFEIRDMIAWVYGSGFPKSHNLKDEWQGWGTALKPALEPITVARKPLIGTVAENVLAHGTGALNIDGCRVETDDKLGGGHSSAGQQMNGGWERPWMKDPDAVAANAERSRQAVAKAEELGRWPANLIHDSSDEVVGLFPADKQGSAARFFYAPKASKRDRDEGLDVFEKKYSVRDNGFSDKLSDSKNPRANVHPTVKPTDLMRYLCRLVTPPNGVVLDPFMGSGSTGKAAMLEGFQFVGIEREAEYVEIAKARISASISNQGKLLFDGANGTEAQDFKQESMF